MTALILIFVAGLAYYHFVYAPAHHVPLELAYVLPFSATVVDTPAELRLDVLQDRDKVALVFPVAGEYSFKPVFHNYQSSLDKKGRLIYPGSRI